MDKNISEEIIEIGGVEYTLFLNRTGIVNWEKMVKLNEKSKEYQNLANELTQDVEITDETDPFALYSDEEVEKLETQLESMKDLYLKFYWVALYTHHKLPISQVRTLFDEAIEEYGLDQLAELANQMLENANKDLINKKRKNLKALKSTHN